MSKHFLVLTIFLLFAFQLHARSPAVEPIMGISIEEIDHVPPEEATPFDFSQPENVSRSPAIEVPTVYDFQTNRRTLSGFEGDAVIPYALIGLVLLLPIVIWFGVMKNLDQGYASPKMAKNTVSLEEVRKRKQQESSKEDIPKAS